MSSSNKQPTCARFLAIKKADGVVHRTPRRRPSRLTATARRGVERRRQHPLRPPHKGVLGVECLRDQCQGDRREGIIITGAGGLQDERVSADRRASVDSVAGRIQPIDRPDGRRPHVSDRVVVGVARPEQIVGAVVEAFALDDAQGALALRVGGGNGDAAFGFGPAAVVEVGRVVRGVMDYGAVVQHTVDAVGEGSPVFFISAVRFGYEGFGGKKTHGAGGGSAAKSGSDWSAETLALPKAPTLMSLVRSAGTTAVAPNVAKRKTVK